MFVNLNLFARARVASNSPFSFLHFETAEAPYLNIFAVTQRSDHGLDESVDDRFSFNLRQACARSNDVNDICFGQVRSPVLLRLCEFILQHRLAQQFLLQTDNFLFRLPNKMSDNRSFFLSLIIFGVPEILAR